MTDYIYEILKQLIEHDGSMDVEVLMTELTKDLELELIGETKKKIAGKLVAMWGRDNDYIEQPLLTSMAEFSNRYFNYSRGWLDDNILIEIKILQNGIERYYALDKLYNPPPPIIPQQHTYINSPTVHGDMIGNELKNEVNTKSETEEKLAAEQLKDIKPNKTGRTIAIIVSILLLLATIAGIILSYLKSK